MGKFGDDLDLCRTPSLYSRFDLLLPSLNRRSNMEFATCTLVKFRRTSCSLEIQSGDHLVSWITRWETATPTSKHFSCLGGELAQTTHRQVTFPYQCPVSAVLGSTRFCARLVIFPPRWLRVRERQRWTRCLGAGFCGSNRGKKRNCELISLMTHN